MENGLSALAEKSNHTLGETAGVALVIWQNLEKIERLAGVNFGPDKARVKGGAFVAAWVEVKEAWSAQGTAEVGAGMPYAYVLQKVPPPKAAQTSLRVDKGHQAAVGAVHGGLLTLVGQVAGAEALDKAVVLRELGRIRDALALQQKGLAALVAATPSGHPSQAREPRARTLPPPPKPSTNPAPASGRSPSAPAPNRPHPKRARKAGSPTPAPNGTAMPGRCFGPEIGPAASPTGGLPAAPRATLPHGARRHHLPQLSRGGPAHTGAVLGDDAA